MASYQELVAIARAAVSEVEPEAVERRLNAAVIIDVREGDEHAQGTLPGALLLPRGTLESTISGAVPDPRAEIVLFCGGGGRSALAAHTLGAMGYSNVHSMAGGFGRWKAEGRPWAPPGGMTTEQRTRYSRHILLPEVGESGQAALLGSSVLLIGAGGLGSPAALYLAAAGIGTLGIIDSDVVDATNLQRQVLHNVDRLGMAKVESARETLAALNPDVKLVTYGERLTATNALDILSGYDVIVDGGDNFPTRYLLNDASLHLRIPVVHGSIFRFEGQASVFDPYNGPCYRCLFPAPPPPELAPSCAEAGVLGVLPGVIGTIQATEAIKVLLGLGTTLRGRLLIYDALEEDFSSVTISRRPDCPACADADAPPRLIDYDYACAPAGTVARG
ncbi:MAG TPA: molybdopterin-synthase adenylyltransferase MoeB [Acidimicrobiia bacterium]|nr:molybdopterin-synthase adenylyltransferase MoeB [Acidimicrobiia bacterium]